MVKAIDIIKQLQSTLPQYTDLFTSSFDITSLTRSGSTATAVTSSPHLLNTGDLVSITGAKPPVAITSLTQVDGIATATTSVDHDLTELFFENIELSGLNESEYNGVHTLLSVPNRQTFTFAIDSGAPATATGSGNLIAATTDGRVKWSGDVAYNGAKIVTVIDPTTFTFQTTTNFGSPAQGQIKGGSTRISGLVTADLLTEVYTKQSQESDLWAFVVLGDVSASKSRETTTDAIQNTQLGEDMQQVLINPFSIFVVVPVADKVSGGRAARDLMEDVSKYLFKSLLGVTFTSVFVDESPNETHFIGHFFEDFLHSFYVHQFQFGIVHMLSNEDAVDNYNTRAFRDTVIEFDNDDQFYAAAVNLDDVPL